LRITVYALNLFDVKYTVSKALGSATAPATWTLGDPRTYGVSAALRF
jgi:outer membrane receptor protein involved in Fe transport